MLLVLFRIEPDHRIVWNDHVFIQDRPPHLGALAHDAVIEEDRILHHGEIMNANPASENRIAHHAARDDGAAGHNRIHALTAASTGFVQNELRRRIVVAGRPQRPPAIVEVQLRRHGAQIHIGVVIRLNRPHVAPVSQLTRRVAGDVVRLEVVGHHRRSPNQPGQYVAPKIMGRVGVFGVRRQFPQQTARREDVVAHRGVHLVRIAGHGRCLRILLVEAENGAVFVGFNHAKLARQRFFHGNRGNRNLGRLLHVELNHVANVHAIDVVGTKDAHQIRIGLLNQVHILVDRIRRAPVPELALVAHLRRYGNHKVIFQQPREFPAIAQMLQKALALKLDQHINRVDS